MPSHFNTLSGYMMDEWTRRTLDANVPQVLLDGAYMEHDGNRYWFVYDRNGEQIVSWECRPFPGCASLIVSSKLEIREDLRGQGLGKYFRQMQHNVYKRAGFAGEIATIRSDNGAMNAIASGVPMGTFASDFGGSYRLWLTTFVTPPVQVQPIPAPVMVNPVMDMDLTYVLPAPVVDLCDNINWNTGGFCDRPLGHQGGHGLIEGQTLHATLDEIASRVGTVQPLPGDGVGMTRAEPDESLRTRIKYSHWKTK